MRITDEQNDIARRAYREGKAFGVRGIRTVAPYRQNAGPLPEAFSRPTVCIYGDIKDRHAVVSLLAGWVGDIEFHK